MNVTQDLMDWLNARNFSQTRTDLLIAPVNNGRAKNHEPENLQDNTQEILRTLYPIAEPENFSQDISEQEKPQEISQEVHEIAQEIHELENSQKNSQAPQDFQNDTEQEIISQEAHELEKISTEEIPPSSIKLVSPLDRGDEQALASPVKGRGTAQIAVEGSYTTEPQETSHPASEYDNLLEIPQDTHEKESEPEISQETHEPEPAQETHDDERTPSGLSANWKEAAKSTGFVLSLDEPPPEIWTRIHENDTDDEEDYEQGTSLQGAAYVPKHGANFTQRLQKTLHERKARAEEKSRREQEDAEKNNHPRVKKAALMCAALLLMLAIAWLGLMFLQTLKISRDEFLNRQEQEKITREVHEPEPTPAPEPTPEPEKIITQEITQEKPKTFDEILREANNAFNVKDYNTAAKNFFQAMELRNNDIRPYIGLAASYRAKGLYFDAQKILDDARKKFGDNLAIDAEENFLQRE